MEVGQLLENCVLQASAVHADELPALKEPTTVRVQKLVEQHWHLQSPVVDVVAGGGGLGGGGFEVLGGGGLGFEVLGGGGLGFEVLGGGGLGFEVTV